MQFVNFGPFFRKSQALALLIACAVTFPVLCEAGASLVSLHSFDIFLNGETPYSSLVQGANGDFYGTTFEGGPANAGVIFEASNNGLINTLYSFTNGVDGAFPQAGLILANDGNFYGTAVEGGTNGSGTIFRITPAGVFTSLYSFGPLPTGGTNQDGAYPGANLLQASDNNLYGTATAGGANGSGTLFKISLTGNFQFLYSFTALGVKNKNSDGSDPEAALIQGADGDLYGTAYTGGTNGLGTIFKYNISQNTVTNLHSFLPPPDGANPMAALVATPDGGAFYGTTSQGGTNSQGTTFRLNQNGNYYLLYLFTGAGDGANPMAPLVLGVNGIFYGTTTSSGSEFGGYGSVFQMQPNGSTVPLDDFNGGANGGIPTAALVQATDGSLYGTTSVGGSNDAGAIYRIDTFGGFFPVLSFMDGGDGSDPRAPLVEGTNGHFYGTAYSGGAAGKGAIFDLTPSGSFSILYSFTNGQDGGFPASGLTVGTDGNLYGTSYTGGAYNSGVAFKVTPQGAFTALHAFVGSGTNSFAEGAHPRGALAQGTNGNFFGTTVAGGNAFAFDFHPPAGTVFEMNSNGTLVSFYTFTNGLDGGSPAAGVVIGIDGVLYGTTTYGGSFYNPFSTNNAGKYGTLFKITTNGVLTHLYTFTNGIDGGIPLCKLVQLADGSFYGTASTGGAGKHGTIFKLDSAGNFTTLYSFTNGIDGAIPDAGLTLSPDGNFYGTASAGGFYGVGTIFEISTNGNFTPLYSFTGGSDGSTPTAPLTLGTDGNFYGTTSLGGLSEGGSAFKLEISGLTSPRITSLVLGPAFNTVTWSALPNQLYQLQSTTDLAPANWIDLGGPTTGTNGLDSFEDIDTGGAQRFYRVLTHAP